MSWVLILAPANDYFSQNLFQMNLNCHLAVKFVLNTLLSVSHIIYQQLKCSYKLQVLENRRRSKVRISKTWYYSLRVLHTELQLLECCYQSCVPVMLLNVESRLKIFVYSFQELIALVLIPLKLHEWYSSLNGVKKKKIEACAEQSKSIVNGLLQRPPSCSIFKSTTQRKSLVDSCTKCLSCHQLLFTDMNVATFWGLRAGLQSIKAVLDATNKLLYVITYFKVPSFKPGTVG